MTPLVDLADGFFESSRATALSHTILDGIRNHHATGDVSAIPRSNNTDQSPQVRCQDEAEALLPDLLDSCRQEAHTIETQELFNDLASAPRSTRASGCFEYFRPDDLTIVHRHLDDRRKDIGGFY